jgi:hypothetical protein
MFTSVYFVIGRIMQGDSFDSLKGELAIDRSTAWYDAAAGASQVASVVLPSGDARLKSLQALEDHIVKHSRGGEKITKAEQAIARIKNGEAFCEICDSIQMDDESIWESAVQEAVWALPHGVLDNSVYATELRELQGWIHRQLCSL